MSTATAITFGKTEKTVDRQGEYSFYWDVFVESSGVFSVWLSEFHQILPKSDKRNDLTHLTGGDSGSSRIKFGDSDRTRPWVLKNWTAVFAPLKRLNDKTVSSVLDLANPNRRFWLQIGWSSCLIAREDVLGYFLTSVEKLKQWTSTRSPLEGLSRRICSTEVSI